MRRALAVVVATAVGVGVVALLVRTGCTDGEPTVGAASPPAEDPVPRRASPARAARPGDDAGSRASAEPPADDPGRASPDGPAAAETPPETPPADAGPFPEGEIPEADRGKGECDLAIDLRDAATGRPHDGRARLWRLGVPADAKWPAGDHVQLTIERGASGVLRNLPAGRYRLEVLSAAPGAEDPPEFLVAGHWTNVRIDVTAPPMHPVRLRIFDETGSPILAAKATFGSPSGPSGAPLRGPAWASPRNPAAPDAVAPRRGGWRSLRSREPTNPVTAGPDDVFLLGEVQGPGRDHSWTRSWTLAIDGRCGVSVLARSEDVARGDFVAVAVPIDRVHAVVDEVVRLPDGRAARAAGARVHTWCAAVPAAHAADEDARRLLPIQVVVLLDGYEQALLRWVPDGPLPDPVVMQPEPPEKSE